MSPRQLVQLRPIQLLLLLQCAVCFEDEESSDQFSSLDESLLADSINDTNNSSLLHFLHDNLNLNLSVQIGATAHLHCRVEGLKDQSVSWYRRKGEEIQLITFGFQNYHNDDRFSLTYEHPSDWRLRIRYVQDRDEGTYECQVSSHPPLIRVIHLHVVVPAIQIYDDRGQVIQEKFYRTGSTIELQCRVSDVPTATSLHLGWYRGITRLNYDATRGGVSVKTELRGSIARSWLRVGDAKPEDSGIYFCNVTQLTATGVQIHVVPDETPAAIQRGSRPQQRPLEELVLILVVMPPALMAMLEPHATQRHQLPAIAITMAILLCIDILYSGMFGMLNRSIIFNKCPGR